MNHKLRTTGLQEWGAHTLLRLHRLALVSLVFAFTAADAQETNLGFEETRTTSGLLIPVGWRTDGTGYEIVADTSTRVEGRSSLRSRRTTSNPPPPGQFGMAAQRYAVEVARGRSLRLTGWIRTDSVTGYAGLWLRADGAGGQMLALENMSTRGPRGTTPWTRYQIEVPVDSSATGVVFGILHPGTGTAWFDSLRLEVVGPHRPRTALFEPGAPPPEDLARLLTDAELAVIPDSSAPPVNDAWAAWVRANARPIRSLGAADFSDLKFLAPLLAGKRIAQLGESGHGVREFNMIKVRLIQYLHEELGYDVLAFESSLFECDRAGRAVASLNALELMRGCIFGVWHTEELLPLFEYVKRTHATARPLLLTGFDVQSSSGRAAERPAFLRTVVATIDTAYARRVYEADSEFRASRAAGDQSYARTARDRLVPFYDSLASWLRKNERTLAAKFRADPAAPALARQTAASLAVHVQQLAADQGRQGTELRDRGMADNLDFVLNELHPGRKVIVWGHNFHLRHRGYAGTLRPDTGIVRTMGTFVAERHRSKLYTVGLYMYRGSAANNSRVAYPVTRAMEGSLESILHRSPWRYSFIDLSRAGNEPATEWMRQRIPSKEWGRQPQQFVPRDEYDGIIFVDRTWPPRYVR